MNDKPRDTDRLLDEVLTSIRESEPGKDAVDEAARNAWAAIEQSRRNPGSPPPRRARPAARRPRTAGWRTRLAVAAAAVLVAALGLAAWITSPGPTRGPLGQVESIDGVLLRVSEAGIAPVSLNDPVLAGERYRTAHGSGAHVRLDDGSLIELNERTDVRLERRGDDTTVVLPRGAMIVDASEQGSGHLKVDAADCRVSVTGTVFSVASGTKGSRVSVIEGEVHVDRRGARDVLAPGDQVTTTEALGRVPVEEEIAWSRNVEQYLALLRELRDLEKEVEEVLDRPGRRYDATLLERVPADTLVYAALPNLGEEIGDAHELIRTRVAQSPLLRRFWEQSVVASGQDEMLDAIIAKVRQVGSALGEEIVVALPARRAASSPEEGGVGSPVLVAQVRDGEALRELLAEHATRSAELGLQVVLHETAPERAAGDDGALHVLIGEGLIVASPSPDRVAGVAAGPGGFAERAFFETLRASYEEGVSWLVAADVETIVETTGVARASESGRRASDFFGIEAARHLLVHADTEEGEHRYSVDLSFAEDRRGVLSWLAEPAPMGALEFVSPDVKALAAVAIKDPATLVDQDLLPLLPEDARAALEEQESRLGLSLRDDLAASLGGEMLVALDGPVLPLPAWRVVVQVYDEQRLVMALERLAELIGETSADGGGPHVAFETSEAGGRVFHALRAEGWPVEVHLTFEDGYLVAGPTRALVQRSLENRRAGYVLPTAPEFLQRLPRDAHVNLSALFMQDLGETLSPMLGRLAADAELDEGQRALVRELAGESTRSLIWSYAGDRSIEVAGRSEGSLLGWTTGALFDAFGALPGAAEREAEAGEGSEGSEGEEAR